MAQNGESQVVCYKIVSKMILIILAQGSLEMEENIAVEILATLHVV